ncbi:RNA polymerase recycling motor HelD [Metabacillus arenae]|uniref:AAA family ATPase n=1 Tax=Metabacillus arenae TaxID=2771434 RepID=A0A926NK10_9BACI|nr:RNA polymerase recycling motor HelD [Metabacillus arenae]MBD1382185.1 AAA family ATPase [Metabacillus arenae]
MADNNQELLRETDRLHAVLNEIDKKAVKLKQHSGGLKKDVIHLRKTFWDDIKVNVDNMKEAIETLSSVKQQAELLSERERGHQLIHKQLATLSRLKDSAYFGRVDFLENDESKKDVVYLGTASLMDENEEEFLIYDWRAPISSLYYDYSPGPAQYETMEGTVKGEMELKRQFIIRNGQMKSMFDTGVTIGDELLKEVLGNHADSNMKSIVATIQKEQNQIIRNEKSKYLIVQGVAGSGKTSAALQRVAYLLYRHMNELTAENIMLFSPNPLFNSYVATVLPELGEDNMQQSTFQEYVEKRVGKRFKLEDPFEQMEYVLTADKEENYQARLKGIQYKASMQFKELIDDYVSFLAKDQLIFKHITFRGEILISAQTIKETFHSLDMSISIPNRIQLVKERLLKELARKEKMERKQEWVLEESELLNKEEYTEVYQELRSDEDTFDDIDREQRLLAKKIVKKHFRPIIKAIKKLKFIDHRAIYRQLFSGKVKQWEKSPENWEEICGYTLKRLKQKELPYEDATPFLYLQDRIEGQKINTRIRYLFIDEAQDYSPFQFAVLKQLFPNTRMTILGDFNQAIYAHTINAPTLLSSELYEKEKQDRMVLMKSYRSTRQIVEFTKGLVAGGEAIEAFNRNGEKPSLIRTADQDHLHRKIIGTAKDQLSNGHQTVAIICKTAQETKEAFHLLKGELDVQLMDKETYTFTKGIIILPAYLAKGIEFDAVIIYNASSSIYSKEFERKLFYTACTRAMHDLKLFFIAEKTPLLRDVPSDAFTLSNG